MIKSFQEYKNHHIKKETFMVVVSLKTEYKKYASTHNIELLDLVGYKNIWETKSTPDTSDTKIINNIKNQCCVWLKEKYPNFLNSKEKEIRKYINSHLDFKIF